jgi:hypothetical protein
MPKNLTPVAEYTGNVTVPLGGDARTALSVETPIQTVTNRAAYAKAHLDVLEQYANYGITGNAASGATLTLSLLDKNGTFTLASNEVELPAAGTYLVSLCMIATSLDTTNPLAMGLTLKKGASTVEQISNRRYSGTAGDSVNCALTSTVVVTTPSSEKLSVAALIGAGNLSPSGSSRLCIRRIL